MKEEIRARVVETAHYILNTGATVRRCSSKFGVSKTTVHKDMRQRLAKIDAALAEAVYEVLDLNRRERHLRGGESTRQKYKGNVPCRK